MADSPLLAIDAMGGDEGLPTMLSGAALALERNSALRFILVGAEDALKPALDAFPALRAASETLHAEGVIEGHERVAQAIRRAKSTSMGVAINEVKRGHAAAAVSAGNTGALMAIAKLALRTIEGIDRPALSAMLPTLGDNDVVMLDLGANAECDARNLAQFAVMGAAYARAALGLDRPRLALLNIGSEDQKGVNAVREAAALLRAADHLPIDFKGYIEGDKISRGDVDVIVSDGFTGNIALKSLEGTARFVTDLLKRAFTSSIRSKVGFLVSRPATELLRHHLDPNNHNGGVFLGLKGVVVKSHGSANAKGVANAIGVAAKLVKGDITRRIQADLASIPAKANS